MTKKNPNVIIITPEELGDFDPDIKDLSQLNEMPSNFLTNEEKKVLNDFKENIRQQTRDSWLQQL